MTLLVYGPLVIIWRTLLIRLITYSIKTKFSSSGTIKNICSSSISLNNTEYLSYVKIWAALSQGYFVLVWWLTWYSSFRLYFWQLFPVSFGTLLCWVPGPHVGHSYQHSNESRTCCHEHFGRQCRQSWF